MQYSAIVDCDLSLAEMIAAGKYDFTNEDITARRFPITGKGKVNINFILKHFGEDLSTRYALEELDNADLRPATIEELLAFGAKYPDEQRKYPIVALGSVARDLYCFSSFDDQVAVIDKNNDSRGNHDFVRILNLRKVGYRDWHRCYRFLAVCK